MDYSLPGFPEFTVPWSLLKFMSIESWMLSNHLLLCCPPFLLPSVFPSIKVFLLQVAKVLELSASVLPVHIQSCFPLGWTGLVSFPGGSVVKNPPVKQEIRVWSLSQEDAWEKWQPTPIFFPGKSHWQTSLVGYSPWGRKRVRHNLVTKTTRTRAKPSKSMSPILRLSGSQSSPVGKLAGFPPRLSALSPRSDACFADPRER